MVEISFAFGVAIYFITWFLTLFMILPFGVRTQAEAGEVESGTAPSAPVNHYIWRKFFFTTILAGLFYAGIYWFLTGDAYLAVADWFFDPIKPAT